MALMPMIFDTSKGQTPQSIAMQRALAAQIMGQTGNRPARNAGEGWGNALASIGQGLAARAYNNAADQAEQEGQASANSAMQNYLRGMITGEASPDTPPPPPQVSTGGINRDGAMPVTNNRAMSGPSIPANVASAEGRLGPMDASGGGLPPDLVTAVKGFEGFTPQASWDYKQHSIGYGTRGRPGETITREQADARLNEELGKAQALVNSFAPDAPPGVKNALTSLTFNAGSAWMQSGLGERIKAKDYAGARERFVQYNKAGGQVLPGLVKRRQAEVAWFDAPAQTASYSGPVDPIPPVPPPMGPVQVASLGGGMPSSGGQPTPPPASPQTPQPAPQPNMSAPAPSLEGLMQLINNPWVPDTMKQVALSQFQDMQKRASPEYQMEREQSAADLAYKRAQTEAMQRKAAGGDTTYGLNPVYGKDAQGNTVMGVIGNDGSFKPVDTGGVNISTGVDRVDLGTHYGLLDKRSGQMVGTLPKDIAGAEAAKVEGKAQGEATASAPADYQAGQNALDLIGQIRSHPGADRGTGFTSMGNIIPGTSGYDFQNLVEQAKGGAFLQAVQQMRGLGALSNNEGAAATQAITRMNTATSKQAFDAALSDYEKIVRQGMDKAQARMGSGGQPQQPSTPRRMKFNPQTGAFE